MISKQALSVPVSPERAGAGALPRAGGPRKVPSASPHTHRRYFSYQLHLKHSVKMVISGGGRVSQWELS